MTETVSGRGGARGERPTRKGLTVERVYTTAGVHPYDEVTWERRDVVQTNWRTGETVFEQRGVEFPDFWSVNASTIVATKYFRGALGTDVREWSLRQLIDRVVKKYRGAGEEHGYFTSTEGADLFEHELTWMLLHQVFSFNSPVWFNVGTAAPQQVSACQPYDALVSTPAGMVPIGELVEQNAVGTKVFDAHGLTSIVAVKSNGIKEVLRLHLKSGQTLDVTSDHLVWRSSGDASGRFVEAGALRTGDKLQWHRRASFGEAEIDSTEVAEAALAGWLQSDGFVGQYASGTNRSLTVEAMTVTDAELAWVTTALDAVFPDAHRKERLVETQDTSLDCRRTRLYGEVLRPFVDRWDLLVRGREMRVPDRLMTAPLPVVVAYLRSLFQAEGYVSARERSTLVGLDMVCEELIRGVQALLARFGIFARVGFKRDGRAGRQGGIWNLRIQNAGDRRAFADEIGFIDPVKADKLERSFEIEGRAAVDVKSLQIDRIEVLGERDVYDIQTDSGEYLSQNLRVHNCFILAVDDSMTSILNWYREEGLIFKGGSGAGLNLSRIRSSKELLSSGGTASGPVSFMRGADASAGTIKSGGATRRAAKMVVLDVDHPDVEEFIETKAREENKIRALRDAGFDMDLGGRDIVSVQYQNANNSVRVNGDFMRAVEKGDAFGLRGRLTGEVIETVDAKSLFRKMAQAAWECADPGIQYDDTINDWHTNPETGRITASNPCFTGDTLVETDEGLLSIEHIVKRTRGGDRLLARAFDQRQGQFVYARITRAWMTKQTRDLVRVRTSDGAAFTSTPDHPYLVVADGWREAVALTPGMGLVGTADVSVTAVDVLRADDDVPVFDLTVEGLHNFVVAEPGRAGIVVHNCSEYMSLDNSSCNLASLNLMKFLKDDGSFDGVTFVKAVELIITAMDVSISFADFPTEAITETTRAYRQLGIGYANLGALLMASGLAYDSEGGRAVAAAITSLMTGAAYKRSAELAGVVGPYNGFARNASAHARVMRKHQAASDGLHPLHSLDADVASLATKIWAEGNSIGEKNGWRNAQSSLLAPTGTIGFMLDADTTGIEPDFSLVKFKKLVGGGSMQIVNQTVPRALRQLGYAEETVEAIVEYIAEHGHVVDAPGLRPEHYEVFDCAAGQPRAIEPMGHVRMMAAVQPFLSGAISKTVNMPESATVEEIEEVYLQGWKLGLKALAVYRDNCKVGQPLSDATSKTSDKAVEALATTKPEKEVVVEYRPTRQRLPKKRPSQTISFTVGGAEGYMTAGSYPDDGLGELFLKMSKQGSTLAGMMDAFSIAVSIGLQYGVPLETYVSKFTNMRFEPAGMTDDPDVRMAQSVVDYIFRRLALDYLPFEDRAALGIYTASERTRQLETGVYEPDADAEVEAETLRQTAPVEDRTGLSTGEANAVAEPSPAEAATVATAKPAPKQAHTSTELLEVLQGTSTDAPLCFTCGTKMRPAGSCYVCEGCGSTSGCS